MQFKIYCWNWDAIRICIIKKNCDKRWDARTILLFSGHCSDIILVFDNPNIFFITIDDWKIVDIFYSRIINIGQKSNMILIFFSGRYGGLSLSDGFTMLFEFCGLSQIICTWSQRISHGWWFFLQSFSSVLRYIGASKMSCLVGCSIWLHAGITQVYMFFKTGSGN